MSTSSSAMTFERFGRSRHVKISSAGDLAMLGRLDEALWVATGAPVRTMNCDATFLSLVDSDADGRIMCFELRRAIDWMLGILSDTAGVSAASQTLRLDAVNADSDQGKLIRQSASRMLERLGAGVAGITLDQVREVKAAVEAMPVSEAGVVLPAAADGEDMRTFLSAIIDTVGGVEHPGGRAGVSRDKLDDFLAQAAARLDWLAVAQQQADVMPLGERTDEVFSLVTGLAGKIEQYFAQCQAVSLDPRTAAYVSPDEERMRAMDLSDPRAIEQFMRDAPLAPPSARCVLAFEGRINPYYARRLARLRAEAIQPALGKVSIPKEMSLEQWREVTAFFSAHEKWVNNEAGRALASLDAETLEQYLQPTCRQAAETLIASSSETAFVLDNIRLTEKLILYQANLLNLANNFVSFPHLYDAERRAMFEMGTLIMDGRRFNFSVKVDNRSQHASVARTGNMFVLYVEVSLSSSSRAAKVGEKYEVAVAVTSGGKGNLCVGKRGVFCDVMGRRGDARVVQIIENPISISEAVLSPFRRLGGMLSGKIEAITSAAENEFDSRGARVLSGDGPAKAPPAQSKGGSLMAGGLLMGGGVALAAVGSAAAYASKALEGVDGWKIVLGVAIAVLAVVLPVSIMGLVKLRKRDLSAILEGSGWAVNARMRLTLHQGRFFTRRPDYPRGARGVRMWRFRT